MLLAQFAVRKKAAKQDDDLSLLPTHAQVQSDNEPRTNPGLQAEVYCVGDAWKQMPFYKDLAS